MDKRLSHGHCTGGKISVEWRRWKAMKQRCLRSSNSNFKNYGGRGIQVCERWMNFSAFYQDMGPIPSPHHTIDRMNNDGDYEPDNCRWATRKEQANNKRKPNMRLITIDGITKGLPQWCEQFGVKQDTARARILRWGYDPVSAVSSPNKPHTLRNHKPYGTTKTHE